MKWSKLKSGRPSVDEGPVARACVSNLDLLLTALEVCSMCLQEHVTNSVVQIGDDLGVVARHHRRVEPRVVLLRVEPLGHDV